MKTGLRQHVQGFFTKTLAATIAPLIMNLTGCVQFQIRPGPDDYIPMRAPEPFHVINASVQGGEDVAHPLYLSVIVNVPEADPLYQKFLKPFKKGSHLTIEFYTRNSGRIYPSNEGKKAALAFNTVDRNLHQIKPDILQPALLTEFLNKAADFVGGDIRVREIIDPQARAAFIDFGTTTQPDPITKGYYNELQEFHINPGLTVKAGGIRVIYEPKGNELRISRVELALPEKGFVPTDTANLDGSRAYGWSDNGYIASLPWDGKVWDAQGQQHVLSLKEGFFMPDHQAKLHPTWIREQNKNPHPRPLAHKR